MQIRNFWAFGIAPLIAGCFFATTAVASTTFTVNVDTSSLSGLSFGLYFQLTDGSQTGDGNNTATLENFNFNGGTVGPCPAFCDQFPASPPDLGDLNSSIVLVDNLPLTYFLQQITPSSSLSFDVTLTTNVDAGDTPDTFSFSIVDGNTGDSLPTDEPSLAMLVVNIDSENPQILTYGTNASSAYLVPTPEVTTTTVPIPAAFWLLGSALASLATFKSRRVA